MAVCAACGQENPDEARFCLACGSPFETGAAREVRKTVTVLFVDLAGSTGLGERLDPEPLRRVMTRYFEEARGALERHGGTVEKFIGDAVVAVFGVPIVHEDDALRAVRAAVELREVLARLNEELAASPGVTLAVRTGVNTGEVVAGAGRESFATGDAVNVAARLQQTAGENEILLGPATVPLVRDAVEVEPVEALELRGRDESVTAYRLLSLRPHAAGVERRHESGFVGRESELRLLADAFDRAERARASHLFTLLGPAGVGKSRLAEEFLRRVGDRARVVRGRCLPYGEGITFWPLAEIVRDAAGLTGAESVAEARARIAALLDGEADADLVADRVSELVGISGEPGAGDEGFWAARRLLEALTRDRTLVVLLDDVNWAEPTFLELVEYVADWARGAPLLLLCLARPDLLDTRPGWAGGKLNASSVLLEPLDDGEASALISARLGGAFDGEIARRVTEVAEGNPLFVEEMLAMLVGEGLVRRAGSGWVAAGDLAGASVPGTIQALLAARIDLLDPAERAVLERASVEGKVFHVGALAALGRDGEPEAALRSLVRKELVRPDRAALPGEDAYRFRHILVRDAAYESMPKELRADLHERFADWLVGKVGERTLEYEEIVAYHLESAFRLREELGRLDGDADRLARAAAERLARAGRRAATRDDAAASDGLLTRAIGLLPEDDPERVELLLPLARARVELGDLEEADRLIAESVERARGLGDSRLEHRALVEQQFVRLKTDPGGSTREVERLVERALPIFQDAGDEAGLATAWDLLAVVHLMACRYAQRAAALERALEHDRRAGGEREADIVIGLETAHYWGPTPVEPCIERCEALLGEPLGRRPTVEAALVGTLAGLQAMRGRFDEARALYARQRAIHEDLGRPYSAAAWTMVGARVEMLAGHPGAAEAELRDGYETLERMGEVGVLSTVAAYLADALYAQGRLEEAERYTRVSEEAGTADDIATQVWWRLTRARLLAAAGDPGGEALARAAVSLTEPTDDLFLRARALIDLAEALELLGRGGKGRLLERAAALSEAKGDAVTAGRAREAVAGSRRAPTGT
ncbi:MAG TPA: AAA family ATPase [Gaiellaceae bacterium]|jgi:class 3 adenylate cyclase/tetratricopeptide (TPR) repeat protein|nr:AAA family ATPase [Gaiellaceae bacterium]